MPIIGNYDIKKELGLDGSGEPTGGFGRVYQAEHRFLGEKACIKQNRYEGKENVRLLEQEAKILWKLYENHSIPSAKDYFPLDDENAVMVMNYIDGDTLEQTIEKNSRLHPEDACWITERLLGAIHYCHYNGVIHADIKPQNIFIEPKKRDIKLIDFGLSSYRPDSSTRPVGYTPRYAAPEVEQGKPPLPETDIYGAGITMLFALGGDLDKKSFPKDTPREIADYCSCMIRYDPMERPNWDKNNPIETLSDIRQEVFGRRHVM